VWLGWGDKKCVQISGKCTLIRPRRRWEDNIVAFQELGCEDGRWMEWPIIVSTGGLSF
jgi:hypothetical protein